MEKVFVAPSYSSAEQVKFNKETNKVLIKMPCPRCSGLGIIVSRVENGQMIPIPVDSGICYQCNGEKFITKWVKAYTEDELAKYEAAQERAREKKAAKAEAIRQEKINKSEENRKELLAKWGYDPENPLIYLVCGGSTYEIKDQLKEQGARFAPQLGWYCCHDLKVPAGYKTITIPFMDVYDWFPQSRRFMLKDNAKETADAALSTLQPESESEYVGEVKERLRDLRVTLTGCRTFDGFYGETTIYTFKYDKNTLVWMTSSCKDIEVGEEVLLTGTVKSHDVYNNEKQTKLSRCIIKKVEE